MKGKRLRRLCGLFLFLVLTLTLFLSCTETGLRCLILAGNRWSGGLLTIGSASGTLLGTIRLQDLRYADGVDTVTIDVVDLAWEPAQLLNGQIRVRSILGTNVRILPGTSVGKTLLTSFSLPIGLTIDTVSADTITIFSGQEAVWTIARGTAGNLSYQKTALHVDSLSLVSDALTLQAKGSLVTDDSYPLQLDVVFLAHPDGYEPIAAHGTINGPLNGLVVEADIRSPFPMQLNGRLDHLLADTVWQAQLAVPAMTLSHIHPDWPEQRFAHVTITGRGTLSDYSLHVQSQAEIPTRAAMVALVADIRGDGNGLAVDSLKLDHGTAQLAVKGGLTWSPRFSWQAEISATRLDPGIFLADWPGDLTGSLTSSGQTTEQGLHISCIMPSIEGTLRTFPLTGNGELSMTGNRVSLPHLSARIGNSVLSVKGQIDETVDFDVRLDSDNLNELWPGAQGTVKASAHIVGPLAKVRVNAQINGDALSWGMAGLQSLRMQANGIVGRNEPFEILAQADNLRLGASVVDTARLLLKGSMQDHILELSGKSAELSAGLFLQGALRENRWQATLSRTRISSPEHGDWQQHQSTALTFSADSVEIKPLCLQSTSAASLCVNGSWQPPPNIWHVHGTASSLPLEPLTSGWSVSWPLTGRLNAELDLTGRHDRLLTGNITAAADGMRLLIPVPDGGDHQVTWRKNTLSARYADNRLQTTLAGELTDHGTIHAELTSEGNPFAPETFLQKPINGSLRLNLQDLSPLVMLADQTVRLTGMLRGQFTINGTPASPVVNGQMDLVAGQAEIPLLGITLSPLLLKVTSSGHSVRLVATAQSGEGALRAESIVLLDQLLSGMHSIHFSGDGFKAVRLPGFDLDASPDLTVLFGAQRVAVQGTVTIPRARITSIGFHRSAIASDDVVVIDDEDASSATVTMPLFTDVTLIAGDDVQIDAYGLKCAIVGKLTVNGQPGRPQTANGTLSVHNGSFTMYGRRLNIDLGRLHFAGGPLTNPGIELRSEKKSEKVTTGVLVSGFLLKPEMHFYSSPFLEQSAIITNLLESTAIGGETRQDTGFIGTAADKVGLSGLVPYFQGLKQLTMIDEIKLDTGDEFDSFSLVFGSWLTPDFYVSYGKNLAEESGQFTTRYTIGKGFSFLTETGESRSGGDIKYEFER
jgi:Uncharacterized protein conserved in bacteria